VSKLPVDDSMLFDHVFHFRRWPFVVVTVFVGILWGVVSCVYLSEVLAGKTSDGGLGATVFFGLLFLFMLFGSWWKWNPKKRLTVGVNADGVFVRNLGMVLWSDIKGFKIRSIGSGLGKQKYLWIILHGQDDFFKRNKKRRLARRVALGQIVLPKHIIPQSIVSIKLEKILKLLRQYHEQNL